MSFHHDAVDGILVARHLYCAYLRDIHVAFNGFVSNAGDAHDGRISAARNDEMPVFVAHASGDECGVGDREELNVGECHWAVSFVGELSDESSVSLVDTFDGDEAVAYVHGYGVIANDVAQGVHHWAVVNLFCHDEVFQFVVYEADVIERRSTVEVDQHLRH